MKITHRSSKCASGAAYADDTETRRSSDGCHFQLYGGAIDWKSSKQKTVNTSSTEAEFLSLSTPAGRLVAPLLRRHQVRHGAARRNRLRQRTDNTHSAKRLSSLRRNCTTSIYTNIGCVRKSKKAKYHATAEVPADRLAKALTAQKHATFVRKLNLVNI